MSALVKKCQKNKSCSEWPPWLTRLRKLTRWTTRTRMWGSPTCSRRSLLVKKVLIVKVAQNDPPDWSRQRNWPGGQRDQGHGVVLHVQEEVYWSTLTFRRRVAIPWVVNEISQDPLDPSSQKNLPGGQLGQAHGVWGSPTSSKKRLLIDPNF